MFVHLENGDIVPVPRDLYAAEDPRAAIAEWLAAECRQRGVRNPDEVAAESVAAERAAAANVARDPAANGSNE